VAEFPEWWEWELELSAHLLKRMVDRGFSEIDLRLMMENAIGIVEDEVAPGRWIVETRHAGEQWHVIVEPDFGDQVVVVVTAYGVNGS
jgi:hypothetical protein